jgi:hypothetical protein
VNLFDKDTTKMYGHGFSQPPRPHSDLIERYGICPAPYLVLPYHQRRSGRKGEIRRDSSCERNNPFFKGNETPSLCRLRICQRHEKIRALRRSRQTLRKKSFCLATFLLFFAATANSVLIRLLFAGIPIRLLDEIR